MAHPTRCVFCGGTPLTAEHVLGEWIAKYYPRRGSYATQYTERDEHKWSKPHTKMLSLLKAYVVCAACNNGWMSKRVESAQFGSLAKMIDRSRRETDPPLRVSLRDQRAIATWAAKVALLYPYTLRPTLDSDPRELREFHRDVRPPRGTYIWIGTYTMGDAHGRVAFSSFWRIALTLKHLTRDPGKTFRVVLTTFVLGHVALRIFQGPYRTPYSAPRADPTIGPWVRIWPPSRRVLTWPTPAMDLPTVGVFARSVERYA